MNYINNATQRAISDTTTCQQPLRTLASFAFPLREAQYVGDFNFKECKFYFEKFKLLRLKG